MISHLCPHGRPRACEDCPEEIGEVFYAEFALDDGERYETFGTASLGHGALEHLERVFEDDEKQRLVAGLRNEALAELDKEGGRPADWVEELVTELGVLALDAEWEPEAEIRKSALGQELSERMLAKVRGALADLGDRRPEACSFFVLPGNDGRPWWVGFMEASPEELRRAAVRFGEEVRWVDFGKTPVLMREALEEGYSPDELETVPDC